MITITMVLLTCPLPQGDVAEVVEGAGTLTPPTTTAMRITMTTMGMIITTTAVDTRTPTTAMTTSRPPAEGEGAEGPEEGPQDGVGGRELPAAGPAFPSEEAEWVQEQAEACEGPEEVCSPEAAGYVVREVAAVERRKDRQSFKFCLHVS